MGAVAVALLGAAFLRPLFRTIAFVALGAVMFFFYFHIVNLNLALQVVLYLLGAYSFVRVRPPAATCAAASLAVGRACCCMRDAHLCVPFVWCRIRRRRTAGTSGGWAGLTTTCCTTGSAWRA